jgi:hypothetical protein
MPTNVKLNPSDLVTVEAFRTWIKESLPNLYFQKEIPYQHLLIYLEYIRELISVNKELDSAFWNQITRDLESNIESLERNDDEF